MVLIVTHKEDLHPTKVIQLLNNWNVPVFRLNTDTFLCDYDVEWNCIDGKISFIIRNLHNGLCLYSDEISSIWMRRYFKPQCERNSVTDENVKSHNLIEARGFLEYLYNNLSDKFSVGNYVFDDVGNSKTLQLQLATELGIKVPDTCYSNTKNAILRLASRYDYLILKSIRSDYVFNSQTECQQVFYAQKVASSSLNGIPKEDFSQTINFVQAYIEKDFELRITVVCDDVFACKICSQSMEEDRGKVDWRQGVDYDMQHEAFLLPPEIAEFCRTYLKRLHLNFGCFDFIVTPKGEYVFLECNPNGQWWWIEELTGLKISESIAHHLKIGK